MCRPPKQVLEGATYDTFAQPPPIKLPDAFFSVGSPLVHSVAPNASQDKAGRSDLPHFEIQAAPSGNAENTYCLSFHLILGV